MFCTCFPYTPVYNVTNTPMLITIWSTRRYECQCKQYNKASNTEVCQKVLFCFVSIGGLKFKCLLVANKKCVHLQQVEVVPHLPNTDHPQQDDDICQGLCYIYQILTPSAGWRLCQRFYYVYQVLTAFSKLVTMSEVALLLPNTDGLRQIEDYVRGCANSTKCWSPLTSWWPCQTLHMVIKKIKTI